MTSRSGGLRFSVIVASRGRPRSLLRTLKAVRQLHYPEFEVVLVADPVSVDTVRDAAGWAKIVTLDEANLSKARNAGIAVAAGDVCAFIDDDAVPEPMWLRHHEAALSISGVSASVGYVRGRDGIGFQSRLEMVDASGVSRPQPFDGDGPDVPVISDRHAVKLVGTNMAIRRDVLCETGGFDPAYRYFLDDSDLSMRLMAGGHVAAVAPMAEVHHALAASPYRTGRRVFVGHFDLARSSAVYLRRHGCDEFEDRRACVREAARRKLVGAVLRGYLEPRRMTPLMEDFDRGWDEGLALELPELAPLNHDVPAFEPVPALAGGPQMLSSGFTGRAAAKRTAKVLAQKDSSRVSTFSYSLTTARRNVRYTDDGYWLHTGGRFGPGVDGSPAYRWCTFASCVSGEIARIAKRRGFGDACGGLGLGLTTKGRQ